MNALPNPQSQESRHTGRVRCIGVNTPIGRVTDISAGGARIEGPKTRRLRPGARFALTLESCFGRATVHAEAMHVERTGFRKGWAGIRFIDPDANTKAMLAQIAYAAAQEAHQLNHSLRRSA